MAPELYQMWTFLHNGHEVEIGPYPNKYEAADEFRNRYGYYPNHIEDPVPHHSL